MTDEYTTMHYKGKCKLIPKTSLPPREVSKIIGWDITNPGPRPPKVQNLERALFTSSEVKP